MATDSTVLGNALGLVVFAYLAYSLFLQGRRRKIITSAVRKRDGRSIASHIRSAYRLHHRMTGLLNHARLSPGDGLLIWPCRAIHTRGMSFPIDAIFLDPRGTIISIYEQVPPNRAENYRGGQGSACVLELAAGQVKALGLHVGEEVELR